MTFSDQIKVTLGLIVVHLMIGAQAITVYMDKYGHCTGDDFDLDGDVYTILPRGGGLHHESLHCALTFKARVGHGVCLTFERFNIIDCRMKMKIYDKSSASGKLWRSLGCKDDTPTQMCTSQRYVTIELSKKKLNRNKNYNFNIQVQESNGSEIDGPSGDGVIGETITGEDVFFASIGIFVAIIVGVIVMIITIAVVIICCCCKKRQTPPGARYQATSTSATQPTQPSAPPPPAPTEYFATQNQVTSMYPNLPQEAPPPYSPHAPSYTQPGYGSQSLYTGAPECKQPMV